MFVGITNTPRDYAWGSQTAIAELLGHAASGRPEAELWLGTHAGSPARIVGSNSAATLDTLVHLPFLLKVLAAAHPLSLQAHPSPEQALAGFARENAAGIPIDAPNRNYRDAAHKPELIYVLSEQFRALCGFRSAAATAASIDRMLVVRPGDAALSSWADRLSTDADIEPCFEWLVSRGDGVAGLIDSVVAAAAVLDGANFALVGELAEEYPGDPGIAISLMLNLVSLTPGQVLYLPAGNIHAYIEGLGIELMAASDNVLRGGLTPKHVDVAELLTVLDFTPGPAPLLEGVAEADGVVAFRPPIDDFSLRVVRSSAVLALAGPAVLLCTAGAFEVAGSSSGAAIARGESLYVSADEGALAVRGVGVLFVASVGG